MTPITVPPWLAFFYKNATFPIKFLDLVYDKMNIQEIWYVWKISVSSSLKGLLKYSNHISMHAKMSLRSSTDISII